MSDDNEKCEGEATSANDGQLPLVRAEELFGPHREICLEFEGVRYRLRITRRNKLILQK